MAIPKQPIQVPPHADEGRSYYYVGLARIRYIWAWLAVIPLSSFFATSAWVASFFDPRGQLAHTLARRWADSILSSIDVQLEIDGTDHIGETRPLIIVANHHSTLDILAVLSGLPLRFTMFAKASLFRIPMVGWYMARVGYMPVQRGRLSQTRHSLQGALDHLRRGTSILVFPEGGRGPEERITGFKRGAFFLARKTGVPVLPVAIRNSGRLMPGGSWWVDPGLVTLRIGKPINPASTDNVKQLRDKARCAVLELAGLATDLPTS